MQKIRRMFKALSMKDALSVYMLVYAGCKIEYYTSFKELIRLSEIKEHSLRRITNTLSKSNLIKSIKGEGKKRYYIVCDKEFAEQVYNLIQK